MPRPATSSRELRCGRGATACHSHPAASTAGSRCRAAASPRSGLRSAPLAPRLQLRAAARGTELVARAVAEAAAADASGDTESKEKKLSTRPKRKVTVKFEELAVGKSFKGTVVRPRAPPGDTQNAKGLGFRLALAADTHHARLQPLTPAPQTSVAAYGVFINIGAALDGLAHISELSVRLAWRRSGPALCCRCLARSPPLTP